MKFGLRSVTVGFASQNFADCIREAYSDRLSLAEFTCVVTHFAIGSPSGLKVPLSEAAFDLLLNVLTEMSRGNAVLVVPINAELTTQEAADLLNVSRPYLIRLLDQEKIPFHMVGRHRRILFKDLMQYRQQSKRAKFKAMQELTEMDEDQGIALAE